MFDLIKIEMYRSRFVFATHRKPSDRLWHKAANQTTRYAATKTGADLFIAAAQLIARHSVAIAVQRLDAALCQVMLRLFARGHFRTTLLAAAAGQICVARYGC